MLAKFKHKNMTDDSILDQIMTTKQDSNLQEFKPRQTLDKLLSVLSTREQDIIKRRFGLSGNTRETLEKIGQSHKITRERVRQLTLAAIVKIKKSSFFSDEIKILKDIVNKLLEENGGVVEEKYLLVSLVKQLFGGENMEEQEISAIKGGLIFMIGELLADAFDKLPESEKYNKSWKLKYANLSTLDKVNESLFNVLSEKKLPQITKELVKSVRASFPTEDEALQKLSDQALGSYFRIDNRVKQNVFGQWGLAGWSTISPKRMNDKIYLVLKKVGKPLHYRDIAKVINESKFDKKVANAETIHNELIMDKRYVLVGRGIYALTEWGYKKGTVADIIVAILKESEEPQSRQEIVEAVLKQRMVKKATIQLALMNKEKFKKMPDGKFMLNKEDN